MRDEAKPDPHEIRFDKSVGISLIARGSLPNRARPSRR